MDVSKSILHFRKLKGLNQSDVAEKLGIERSNYARLEKRGNKITIEQALSIAQALDITIYDLFEESESSTSTDTTSVSTTSKPTETDKFESLRTRAAKVKVDLLKLDIERLNEVLEDKEAIIKLLKNSKRQQTVIVNQAFEKVFIDNVKGIYLRVERDLPELKGQNKRSFIYKQFYNQVEPLIEAELMENSTVDRIIAKYEKKHVPYDKKNYPNGFDSTRYFMV